MKNTLIATLLGLALTTAATGQTVWFVTQQFFFDQALAQCAPGDVIRLNGGPYEPFDLNKGITIIGPAWISEEDDFYTNINTPANQKTHIVDLNFVPYNGSPDQAHVVTASGDITFENCTFGEGFPSLAITGGNVILQSCLVQAYGHLGGVVVDGGIASIIDSDLYGAWAITGTVSPTFPAKPALQVNGGGVLASHLFALGGPGIYDPFDCHVAAAPGVYVAPAGSAYFTDSTIVGGTHTTGSAPTPFGPGETGIHNLGSCEVSRTTVASGAGGVGTPPPIVGSVPDEPKRPGMQQSVLNVGTVATFTATAGDSQGPLLIVASLDYVPTILPITDLYIFALGNPYTVLDVSVPGPGATVTAWLPIPNDVALLYTGVWSQALQLAGPTLFCSPLSGGTVH